MNLPDLSNVYFSQYLLQGVIFHIYPTHSVKSSAQFSETV